jgi:hypothetical protein
MEDQVNATPASQRRVPWNKGKLTGANTRAERTFSARPSTAGLCHERTRGFLLDHFRPVGVTAYTKKKGRLHCHKRPKSREETPKQGSDSAGGGYCIPVAKTIAISGSIERKDHGPIPRFIALALKADHFRYRSDSEVAKRPALVRCYLNSRHSRVRCGW